MTTTITDHAGTARRIIAHLGREEQMLLDAEPGNLDNYGQANLTRYAVAHSLLAVLDRLGVWPVGMPAAPKPEPDLLLSVAVWGLIARGTEVLPTPKRVEVWADWQPQAVRITVGTVADAFAWATWLGLPTTPRAKHYDPDGYWVHPANKYPRTWTQVCGQAHGWAWTIEGDGAPEGYAPPQPTPELRPHPCARPRVGGPQVTAVMSLMRCEWGFEIWTPDDKRKCRKEAVKIVVLHDPNDQGAEVAAVKLCDSHLARIEQETTPHAGEPRG
jgi:hypothetical protein